MQDKQTIKDFLVEELLPSFNPNNHAFNASIQEEFMVTGTPYLDKTYISQVTGSNLSIKSFRQLCIAIFGTDRFNYVPTPEEDLDQELFDKHYEFGKFVHGRQWVTYFGKQLIFTKRSTVLGYIYDARD